MLCMKRVILSLLLSVVLLTALACSSGRFKRVEPGMSKTDVMMQLGRPDDIEPSAKNSGDTWYFSNANRQNCKLIFENGKVAKNQKVTCDNTPSRRPASLPVLTDQEEEKEFLGRQSRYCGAKPTPREGCKID